MNAAARAYTVQFLSAMAAYVVLLLLSVYVLQHNPTAAWRGLVAVLARHPGQRGSAGLRPLSGADG